MINLIIPIAGRSSRFPNMNPKWSLTHPRGDMMVVEAIKGINMEKISKIYIIALKEHEEKFRLKNSLSTQFISMGLIDRVEFILLEEQTRNQPETIAQGIILGGISGPIYIKDSDNFFRDDPVPANSISGYDLHLMDKVNARSKSYFEVNADGFVNNIVEKKIVGSKFCAGGYSFESAEKYMEYFTKYSREADLYISHIVYGMILDGVAFSHTEVGDYIDWGTIKEWRAYTRLYSTLFVDLDGTLVKNSSQYSVPQWGDTEGIRDNIEAVNHLFDSGKVEVIITTSRKESYRDSTLAQLQRVGIRFHNIIFGLPHGKRIIVNDYAASNPFKSCDAINLKRNSSDLKEMLEDSIGFHLDLSIGDR